MDVELKDKWVKALRSGKYKQGIGYLKRTDDGTKLCCIGVLLDIQGAEWSGGGTVPMPGCDATLGGVNYDCNILPDEFCKRFSMTPQAEVGRLMDMNDGGGHVGQHTFAQIADYIEKNL